MDRDVEALRKPGGTGFKYVTVTSSSKYQVKIWVKEEQRQRDLGLYNSAEEAAKAAAAALRDGLKFDKPTKSRAKRGTVRPAHSHRPCPAPAPRVVTSLVFDSQASLTEEDRELLEEHEQIKKAQEKARKERRWQEREEKKKEREERREGVVEPAAPRVPLEAPKTASQALLTTWLGRSPATVA